MTPTEWATLLVAILTIITGFAGVVRWLVKHYLYELRPNGGSSLKDKVNLLEEKVELLTELVKEALRHCRSKAGNCACTEAEQGIGWPTAKQGSHQGKS